MNEKDANNIMILYNAKYNNSQITIEQFVNYIIDDISKNPEYKDNIDAKTLANLKQLKTFINKQKINEQMTASELAEVFGINKITVEQLLLFNRTTQNSTTTMTINEFAKFALSLKNETQFQSMFTPETISKLTLLQTLSNDNIINQKQTSAQLEKTMKKIGINDLDQSTLNLLYFYNYYKDNPNTSTKLSLNEFTKNVLNDNNIKTMLPSEIEQYKPILNKFSDKAFITTKLNSSDMAKSMKPFGLGETQIKHRYETFYIQNINPSASSSEAYNNTVIKLTPYELLNIVKTKLPSSHPSLKQIQMLINIMDLSYNQAHNIVPKFTSSELSTYLSSINNNINNQTIALGYSYNDYKIKSNKTMSVKQIINFLEKNKTDPIISSKIGGNASTLTLAYKIINNTETKFNKIEMSNVIGQPESIVKNIYNVADYKKLTNKLTPKQFVNLILNNKNNPLIKSKLTNETIIKLNLVNKVMESIEKGTKYTANELSNIFGTNKEKTSLIISLYKSEDNKNQRISLKDFTTFIINDVITNKEFLNKINEEQKTKLKIVNGLINGSISGTKYNSLDLYNILKQLTDKLDYNLVDMVYIYNGSQNKYNESWKMTIEKIINYVSSDILNNEKYSKFIDNDMREKIEDSKVTITDAKKLLINDKYSRVLINSKYPQESKATFDFVQKIKEQFIGKEGIYVIGNSPMALEISKTFNQEMDYITILTIIFIFIVVALTFKDILIPIILVVIIQTAVHITMTTLSISGSSVYFIALLIVQSILMGATIDYGIVYTTYYKELRKKMGIKDAMINSYNKSIYTIISSSSILIIVTLIVSAFAEAIPAQICKTISQGTIASAILILFILPGVLATFDKIICRKENKINKQK